MSTATPDYAAIAAQNGAVTSTPAPQQTSTTTGSGQVDYDAIAKQYGAVSTGTSSTGTSSDSSNLSTNEMMLTSLGGPWANDPRLTAQEKAEGAQGRAAGAVSVPIVAGATLGATAIPEVAPSLFQKAQAVASWAKANPLKSAAIEGIARELGVDPFQLAHKAVKYGKELFGGDEK